MAKCLLESLWKWNQLEHSDGESQQWSCWAKRRDKRGRTADLGDNSLWVHFYKQPLENVLFIWNICIHLPKMHFSLIDDWTVFCWWYESHLWWRKGHHYGPYIILSLACVLRCHLTSHLLHPESGPREWHHFLGFSHTNHSTGLVPSNAPCMVKSGASHCSQWQL